MLLFEFEIHESTILEIKKDLKGILQKRASEKAAEEGLPSDKMLDEIPEKQIDALLKKITDPARKPGKDTKGVAVTALQIPLKQK